MTEKKKKQKKKSNLIEVPNVLKDKAGEGGEMPIMAIKEAQMFITSNDIDFKPMASRHLKEIDADFKSFQETEDKKGKDEYLKKIIENIMQIKAHGGMFHYQIMSDIANVVLHFLEGITEYHAELYQIIEAHNNSIRIVIKRNIKGDGGMQGQAIIEELQKVTKRYQKKYRKK